MTTWKLDPSGIPPRLIHLRERLGLNSVLSLSFTTPASERVEFVGRNHPLTATLAEFLLATALADTDLPSGAARCDAIQTRVVTQQTTLLLRVRHLLREAGKNADTLAEECMVAGFQGLPTQAARWLSEGESRSLLNTACPERELSQAEVERRLTPILDVSRTEHNRLRRYHHENTQS